MLKRARAASRVVSRLVPLLLVLVFGLGFFELRNHHVFIVGDGIEYACNAHNFVQNLRPYGPDWSLRQCSQLIGWPENVVFASFAQHGAQYDAFHFWLVSLLASPFWGAILKAGLNPLHGFTVLHFLIFCGIALLLPRLIGTTAGAFALLLAACSPLAFLANKAHAEIFLSACLLLAFACIAREELGWAAFCFAVGSAHQLTFIAFAGICGLVAIARGAGTGSMRRKVALPIFTGLCLAAIQPLYYLLRYGRPTLLSGAIDRKLAGFSRAASLFIDPDLGLFPNWPLGLAAVLAIALGLLVPKDRVRFATLSTAVLGFCLLEALLVTIQTNWNSGGTVFISRYALYFIAPLAVAAAIGLERLISLLPPTGWAPLSLAAGACVLWYGWSAILPVYHPKNDQVYLRHSPLAEQIYETHPKWHDPIPEVFLERTLQTEQYAERLKPGDWAVGNSSCRKLLILKPIGQLRTMTDPPDPIGCVQPNSSRAIFDDLVAGRRTPTRHGYINVE